jgi:Asp/Glu/hydantoin racemase
MRLLLLNPNMTLKMTEEMAGLATTMLNHGSTLVPVTATTGFPYISSRAEALIAGGIALDTIASHRNAVDAVVIAAFGDPGLLAARELFDMPIVGMAEAAMLSALLLGQRFSFVTFSRHLRPWYEQSVTQAGLQNRFAGVRTPDTDFKSIGSVQEELFNVLRDLVQQAVDTDGADVVILAGAPLAGLAQRYTDSPVPLVDPISAAVTQAQALFRLAPRGAHGGSFTRPPPKPSTGLPYALAARFNHTD